MTKMAHINNLIAMQTEDIRKERDRMKVALLKCREEFCWHGNTGKHLHAYAYAELVDMIDAALGEAPLP